MSTPVICEQCRGQGIASYVTAEGPSVVTAVYRPPFFDENGYRHDHDPNRGTSSLKCSRGHRFTRTSYGSCWCGWQGGQAP